jgi:hypothetical protein
LSKVRTDKFFQFVQQSWSQLVHLKPAVTDRFSYAEFKHCMALALYGRVEKVKFDVTGVKPGAPTRVPLPKDLRVFQPIWSILASIGLVRDDELGVDYIPDTHLPASENLIEDPDIEGIANCTLYDWSASWQAVTRARDARKPLDQRYGITDDIKETETLSADDRKHLMVQMKILRETKNALISLEEEKQPTFNYSRDVLRVSNNVLQARPNSESQDWMNVLDTPDEIQDEIDKLFQSLREDKVIRQRPDFNTQQTIELYTVESEPVRAERSAYGSWLRWDSKLWVEYSQFVEIVSPIAMFSLSMPNEPEGDYTWLLPIERSSSGLHARLPKRSIPLTTWLMAIIVDMSTLPLTKRSTWYVESDSIHDTNIARMRYIRAALKHPAATEHFGI